MKSFMDCQTFGPVSNVPLAKRSQQFKLVKVSSTNYELIRNASGEPKTLLCHDMKGGYLEDRFAQGCTGLEKEPYRFVHWSLIDTFVYFSHNFITIPVKGWIEAAHTNGVSVLGTIITENKQGYLHWKDVFVSRTTTDAFISRLVQLTTHVGFDGWLLNVENSLERQDEIDDMLYFAKSLHTKMHQVDNHSNSKVIWYDSLTTQGKLEWQDELNKLNYDFFECCDGIFLNYTWKVDEEKNSLQNSLKTLQDKGQVHRLKDIFVGVDVFGRGCLGDGGFNCRQALAEIRKMDMTMSVAIFAPGWTHETMTDVDNNFSQREYTFWTLLQDHLYVRGPKIHFSQPGVVEFETHFCPGYGRNVRDNSWWLDLCKQDNLPSILSCPQEENSTGCHVGQDFCPDDTTGIKGCAVGINLGQDESNVVPVFVCEISTSDKLLVMSRMRRRTKDDYPRLFLKCKEEQKVVWLCPIVMKQLTPTCCAKQCNGQCVNGENAQVLRQAFLANNAEEDVQTTEVAYILNENDVIVHFIGVELLQSSICHLESMRISCFTTTTELDPKKSEIELAKIGSS